MATLLLQAAGSAVGSAIGGPAGAMIGRAVGAVAGSAIDSALLGGSGKASPRIIEGPRLEDVGGLTSTEGAPIPRLYGRARIGGELIWATRVQEVASTSYSRTRASGGKSTPKPPAQITATTTYSYYVNLAVGLCEGPISFVRRVWADGKEIDLNGIVMRVHRGTQDQMPDGLIIAKEGAGNAPAYRGLAYAVFENLPIGDYGNRIPQFTFEVVRAVGSLNEAVRAVCLIPGASEFGYDTLPVARLLDPGVTRSENRHQFQRGSDIAASLDALQALCPNLTRVSLVVSWFGTDLRAGECRIEPRVEISNKTTDAVAWSVAGLSRVEANAVSQVEGRPAYGGTPTDASVIRLIQNLKARGLSVVLYPFVMMDVPAGNALPNPYGGTGQPPYPWRGRITCHPAPGEPGSPDGTEATAIEVDAFFGAADGWGLRRQILHYAGLAVAAGGVDGFIIGSELVSLTRVRSGSGAYPATAQLIALAGEVRAILGSATKISYAADWTEYGAHVSGGGAEVRFPLDPLWASDDIDAVGIDFYPPLTDWRDGADHLDADKGRSLYDLDMLVASLGEGPDFDFFYASEAERQAQIRTPISDGAYGKPWVFRAKDIAGWWGNAHVERVGGVELTSPTAWRPMGKPIWLTEIGVPAVDKGTNGPNVFPDPKSSENAAPPLSNGSRDDLIQLRGVEAILTRFDPDLPGHPAGANPLSPLYGGRMVDPASIFVWAWDARPFPAFPTLSGVWSDGANWDLGHWLTGRIEGMGVDALIRQVLADRGDPAPAEIAVDGFLDGYVIERPMSARAALDPLARLFGFDAIVSGGALRFAGRTGRAVATLTENDLVPGRDGDLIRFTRAEEAELPREIRIGFTEAEGDYRRAAVASRRLAGAARREIGADIAAVMTRSAGQRLADIWLQDVWVARENAEFMLGPTRLALEIGDVVALSAGSTTRLYRITRIVDGPVREVSARALSPSVYEAPAPDLPRAPQPTPAVPGKPLALVLDLPAALSEPPTLQWAAVFADPWPNACALLRSGDGESFELVDSAGTPAILGETLSDFPPGPLWRFDEGSVLDVKLRGGFLSSLSDEQVLNGAGRFAIRGEDGAWEIASAANAELIGEGTWRLSRFLRGLGGSEGLAARAVPAGAPLVMLDSALVPLTASLSDIRRPYLYRVGPAGLDHSNPAFAAFTASAGDLPLRPYAPVHLKARRVAEGILISWIRRARLDGDGWEIADPPLCETSEAYEVDVLDGGVVVRTLSAGTPQVLYTQEIADFGEPQTSLSLRVAQMSALVGRGFAAERAVAVTA